MAVILRSRIVAGPGYPYDILGVGSTLDEAVAHYIDLATGYGEGWETEKERLMDEITRGEVRVLAVDADADALEAALGDIANSGDAEGAHRLVEQALATARPVEVSDDQAS